MEAWRRELVVQVLTIVALVAASAQDGTATGSLTINGATVALRHAYASVEPGFFDKKKEDIHILLSSVPLSDAARADAFGLIRLAREGSAQIVEVVLDSEAQPISGAIFAKPFNGMLSLGGMHRFEKPTIERTRIAGRLSMEGPKTIGGVTFQYDAVFSAAIPRPPTAHERAAALASPPAMAARTHVAAIRSGRIADLVVTLTAAAAADYRGPDAAARLAQLRAETPPDSRVVDLRQTGDTAVATVQGHRDGIVVEFTLNLARESGAWKIGK